MQRYSKIEPISAISSVGFPIVAFLLMYKFATDTIQSNTNAFHELKEAILKWKR